MNKIKRRERGEGYITVTFSLKLSTLELFNKVAKSKNFNKSEFVDSLIIKKLKRINNIDLTK